MATADSGLLDMVTTTLDAMARGGIYDQLGGGFHRYSTDENWLVPHFEKMLYDNAQLARVYLHAWQVTRSELYRRIAIETLDYLVREMLDDGGGFYSAQDADSEGEEGRFFVWTAEEIRSVVSAVSPDPDVDVELVEAAYGVTAAGNFEGRNILVAARSPASVAHARGMDVAEAEERLTRTRAALFEARRRRVAPGRDEKVLAGWNGLVLAAFAEAARVLDREDYRAVAERCAGFLLGEMRDPSGRMRRTWRAGQAKLNGQLEDYAYVANGLLELYRTTFEPRWFAAARELADAILDHFAAPGGGFFDTSDDHEELLLRPRTLQDGAVPSGGSAAAYVLLELGAYTGERRYVEAGESAVAPLAPAMGQAPLGFANWLAALDLALGPPQEVAIVGADADELLAVVRRAYRPNVVVAAAADGGAAERSGIALLASREAIGGRATAYVCRQHTCERPVTTAEELEELLGA